MGRMLFVFLMFAILKSVKASSQLHLQPKVDSTERKISISPLPQNFYKQKMGYFCKKELQLQKAIYLPVFFRLGSKEYVDYLERKPNAIKRNWYGIVFGSVSCRPIKLVTTLLFCLRPQEQPRAPNLLNWLFCLDFRVTRALAGSMQVRDNILYEEHHSSRWDFYRKLYCWNKWLPERFLCFSTNQSVLAIVLHLSTQHYCRPCKCPGQCNTVFRRYGCSTSPKLAEKVR